MTRRAIALLALVVVLLAGAASIGAGWTWDEDHASFQAGPHEGSDF